MTTELLPKCMHKKHGSYYFVTGNRWIRLGKSLGDASVRMAAIQGGEALLLPPVAKSGAVDWLDDSFRKMLTNSRGRAKKQGLEHSLTMDELRAIAASGRYCCAVTGMLFSNEKLEASNTRPFFPSIDRIDSKMGYVARNCRLVSVAANYAMNAWGETILTKMSVAHLRKQGYVLRQSKKSNENSRLS
jgi:hypothetical protein